MGVNLIWMLLFPSWLLLSNKNLSVTSSFSHFDMICKLGNNPHALSFASFAIRRSLSLLPFVAFVSVSRLE